MCTALTLSTKDHYFGRTLDLDSSYGEEVCVMPRHYELEFRQMGKMDAHYAIIGMATVAGGTPLFYDAANEQGLAMAGLNFPGNAWYAPLREDKDNIAPFEFIPWILGQCRDLSEARVLLERISITDISFSAGLPNSPLHWIIADRSGSLVVEAMADGLHIHDNPVGVMTNNPPFEYQLFNLNNYRSLRNDTGGNSFDPELPLKVYCQGLGALGLPGDLSSMSRFVRIAFARAKSVCAEDELSSVGQFFHLLGNVEMYRGGCLTDGGKWDVTGYTACINTQRGLYYYTSYDNQQINCVNMHHEDLDGKIVSRFPLRLEQAINCQN